MEILDRTALPLERFGESRAYRLIVDPRAPAQTQSGHAWSGLGALIGLTDVRCGPGAAFAENDDAFDRVLFVVDGQLDIHTAAAEPGVLASEQALVQRAGATAAGGAFNRAEAPARVVRLMLLPSAARSAGAGDPLTLQGGRVNRVYDGDAANPDEAPTHVDIAVLQAGQSLDVDMPFVAYMVTGAGFANEDHVAEGTLFRADQLTFDATEDTRLLIVHQHR